MEADLGSHEGIRECSSICFLPISSEIFCYMASSSLSSPWSLQSVSSWNLINLSAHPTRVSYVAVRGTQGLSSQQLEPQAQMELK